MLRIVPISKNLKVPSKAHPGDAGWDVYALTGAIIMPGDRWSFNLGFRIIGEPGKVYIVAGKSGLAKEKGINTIGNIIDNQYRGEVTALLHNTSKYYFQVEAGQKIAQILVQNVDDDNILLVEDNTCVEETERGSNGFGSSGV